MLALAGRHRRICRERDRLALASFDCADVDSASAALARGRCGSGIRARCRGGEWNPVRHRPGAAHRCGAIHRMRWPNPNPRRRGRIANLLRSGPAAAEMAIAVVPAVLGGLLAGSFVRRRGRTQVSTRTASWRRSSCPRAISTRIRRAGAFCFAGLPTGGAIAGRWFPPEPSTRFPSAGRTTEASLRPIRRRSARRWTRRRSGYGKRRVSPDFGCPVDRGPVVS